MNTYKARHTCAVVKHQMCNISTILSLNSFSLTMTANITGFTITGEITGYSQYIVYITGNATVAYTVSNNLGATIKTNWTSPITIIANGKAILSIRYDSTNYYLKLDLYN